MHVGYSVGVVRTGAVFEPNGPMVMGGGPVTGSFDLLIEDGRNLQALVGTTPTNSLIGGTPALTFSQTAGSIRVRLGVNRGLLTASHTGDAVFAIETQLRVTNNGGQSIVVVGACPLADVKTGDIEPKGDPLVDVSFSVPWDGNDANGEPMGGTLSVDYSFQLVHAPGGIFDPKGDPLQAVGKPLAGMTPLPSGPVDQGQEELIGDTPASHLIGDTPTITYSAAGAGFSIMTGLNQGIFEASHTGEADFRIETRFTLTNDAGQRIIVIGTCPVADLKAGDYEPKGDPLVNVSFSIPWDGNDENGNAMNGGATLSYSFQLQHMAGGHDVEPKGDPLRAVGRPVSGSVSVSLGGGTQLQ